MRTVAPILFLAATVLGLSGCDDGRSRTDDETEYIKRRLTQLENQLDDARSKLAMVRMQADDVIAAISQSEDEADRFGSENWQYVVPDVSYEIGRAKSASDDLDDAITDLEAALTDES